MVKIVIVKNPFCPAKDRVTILEEGGKTLKEYIDNYVWADDLYIEVNGKAIDDYHKHERDLIDEGFIAVMPKVGKSGGGKAILGLVASIGLAVATGGIGAGGLASWGAAFGKGMWGAYMMAAAVTMVGGFLINKLCYKENQSTGSTDPTYEWSGVQTLDSQGNGVQLTYGKVKAGGQSIQKYTTSKGSDQWFHWLVACGEGELAISDIRLNGNPYTYYDNVIVDVRNGTNDQSIIPNFSDTYSATTVNAELRHIVNNSDSDNTSLSQNYAGWVEQRIDGNTTEGLRIEIEFQQGLYHYSSKGKIKNAWVKIWAQYRKVGASSWSDFVDTSLKRTIKNYEINKATQSAYRQTFQMDKIPMGQYEVRICVCSRSASTTSTKDMTRCWWSLVESVIYDDFTYPNTALIGIKAKATAQLNSSTPTLTFVKERAKVWVWNGSSYVQKKANNPAWACYDFMCGIRRLKKINTIEDEWEFVNQGVPKELVIYEQFNAWADNCSRLNLQVNLEINQVKDWWGVCNNEIASVGRGLVVQFGTRYGCIYDHVQEPVQLFNQGNIIQGSFEMSYLGTEDRADAIELTYIDADREYEKTQLTVYSTDYDKLDIPNNPTQITMNGITSYKQAYREAKYQLMCNKLMQKTATWKADVEAISCMVGDVVMVASDVVQWGISGRIEECNGNTITIPIDWDNVPSDLLDNDLAVMIRQSDSNIIKTFTVSSHIVNDYGDVDIVLNNTPNCEEGDLFVLGQVDNVAKYFTVTSIQRTKDLEYTISGLEYNEGVFNENYTIPTKTPAMMNIPKAPNVLNLEGSQNSYVDGFGANHSNMTLTWNVDSSADNFTVWLKEDGDEDWHIAGTTPLTEWHGETEPNTIYQAKIEAGYQGKLKMSNTIRVLAGIDIPPPNVEKLTQRLLSDGTRMIWWDYTYPTPNDIAGFEFRWSVNDESSWNNARKLHEGLITSQPFETLIVTPQAGCILCCAVDNSGQYSTTPAVLRTTSIDTLKDNVVFEKHLSDNWNDSSIAHNGVINANGELVSDSLTTYWSDPQDAKWSGAEDAAWDDSGGFKPISLETSLRALASGNIWIEFESNNRCWCDYRITTKVDGVDVVGSWQPNIQKAVVKGGDLIEVKVSSSYTNLQAVISDIAIYIDTEDRQEHFEDIPVPAEGLELPIETSNYYTTGIKIDDIQTNTNGAVYYEIESWTPCKVRFYKITRGTTFAKTYVACTADITWQGFSKEEV